MANKPKRPNFKTPAVAPVSKPKAPAGNGLPFKIPTASPIAPLVPPRGKMKGL